MKLEKVFADAQTYESLCVLAEKAEPKISFLGSNYLTVEGYEGALHIDALTQRVFELVDKYDFNETERSIGKRIAKRIDYIYDTSDAIFKVSNLFTKILAILRSFSLHTTPRSYWKVHFENQIFEYYTRSQFKNVYGYSPEDAEKRGYKLGIWQGDSDRWNVKSAPSSRWFFGLI